MSLPPKVVPKPAVVAGPGTGPSPSAQLRATLTSVSLPPGPPTAPQPPAVAPPHLRIPRVQPALEEHIFPAQPGVAAIYSVPRHQVPPYPTAHDLSKGHPALSGTPPSHASSAALSQVSVPAPPYRCLKSWEAGGGSPYISGQNAGTAPLVYSPQTQPMSVQPQTRPFVTGPRPAPHQGGFRPFQFLHRAPMQPARTTIPTNTPPIRPSSQPPTATVYPTSQPIMMTMTMPFPTPQAAQYYIPQYRHSTPYVAPPQQYSVQPPTSGTFYPGPGPGEYPAPYATPPYYAGQSVYPPSPPIIVPTTPQQPPPAKREKKPIRIRDPNQGGRDITEEIMSGNRNPTPPVSRPSSTLTPPQQPSSSQTPEQSQTPTAAYSPDLPQQHHPPVTESKSTPEDKTKLEPIPHKPPSPSPGLPEASTEASQREAPSLAADPSPPHTGRGSQPSSCQQPAESLVISGEPEIPKPAPVAIEVSVQAHIAASETPLLEPVIQSPPASASPSPPPKIVNGVLDSTAPSPCADLDLQDQEPPVKNAPSISAPVQPSSSAVPPREELWKTPDPSGEQQAELQTPLTAPTVVSTLQASTSTVNSVPAPPPGLPPLVPPSASVENDSRVSPDSNNVAHNPEEMAQDVPDTTDLHKQNNLRKASATAQSTPAAPKTWKKPNEGSLLGEAPHRKGEEVPVREPSTQDQDPQLSADNRYSPLPTLDSQDSKPSVVPHENGEMEPEPLRNGANHAPETESIDSGVVPGDQDTSPAKRPYLVQEELVPSGKRQYDRDFLLGFQFMPACVQKPEGLPQISDVVLDKMNQNKLPSRTIESRLISRGPDFTPAFADFGRQIMGGRGSPLISVGPRRPQPRKIITHLSVNNEVQLKKSENAWKPGLKREGPTDDPDSLKTQDLFRKVRSILNKLTPQMFNQLMKQVAELTIDTEERLKGVIDLVFEKAIDEPSFSVAYGNMCRCLATLKVPMADKPNTTVNFRKLLLNRCQKEFERDKVDDVVFERKQKELDSAATTSERDRLQEELEEAKDKARRRSIGNIKFIGELFKLKMLTEAIMHDCVVKLLKNHDEESLECLCRLLTTIGKDLDFEKAKPRMDQYFTQMEKIVKERKTSSRIRFMLQDVIDLRLHNWVSRRADQGPKTIEQIHKEAKIEEEEEQRKVYQLSTKDSKRRPDQRDGRSQRDDWNTVPMSKNSRTIDPSKIPKISKPPNDDKIQLGPRAQLNWMKGSSGGAKTSDTELSRSTGSSLNRFQALQSSPAQPSTTPSPNTECDSRRTLGSRGSVGRERSDKPSVPSSGSSSGPVLAGPFNRGSSSKEPLESPSPEEVRQDEPEPHPQRCISRTTEERRDSDHGQSHTPAVKVETPVSGAPVKTPLSEEEMERKCRSIIDEFLHINDYKEAVQCVSELDPASQLCTFVRVGVEATLERSQITRDHMGQLFFQLLQRGTLTRNHFFRGISDTLELADDMAIDIPHIWLYLAELLSPVLREGGISMRELFTEISKPLLPVGSAGILFSEILHLLCKQMSHRKVGALWAESGLNWSDFLPEGEELHTFISEHKLQFTTSDCSSPTPPSSQDSLSPDELTKQLEQLLLEDMASDEQIFDWVEANLDESQMSSSPFLRALMTAVCKAAVKDESTSCSVDTAVIQRRLPVLLKYLSSDTERQLQALYALQALIVTLDQPPNLLRMFFDCLYDEDVISEDAFYKWETSKDPEEQQGKGVALKSVTAFFTWLREAEEESEDN
ncbi:LOW QUALITY PROTEIN: eukaryotic translation initiation factor 4 gamma 3 [Denticeps clupeoides]|uniref:LOW QUALITY PROTEIN: eukaryotic translation initiation factor 4 gamma 3 n=1 Tax=Denticeps clupeoides TaxID=299321 RepID=UPI0010A2D922|nr:LOW QUALITY PROTEIN: eukaryotic translation initiation factor 4 gamma 3-like [Denticeps clupeoides]